MLTRLKKQLEHHNSLNPGIPTVYRGNKRKRKTENTKEASTVPGWKDDQMEKQFEEEMKEPMKWIHLFQERDREGTLTNEFCNEVLKNGYGIPDPVAKLAAGPKVPHTKAFQDAMRAFYDERDKQKEAGETKTPPPSLPPPPNNIPLAIVEQMADFLPLVSSTPLDAWRHLRNYIPEPYSPSVWGYFRLLRHHVPLFEMWTLAQDRGELAWSETEWNRAFPPFLMRKHMSTDLIEPFETVWLDTETIDAASERLFSLSPSPNNFSFVYVGTLDRNPQSIKHALRRIEKNTDPNARFGMVVNLNSDLECNPHWVSIVYDRHAQQLEYFDSRGDPPPNVALDDVQPLATTNTSIRRIRTKPPKGGIYLTHHVRQLLASLQTLCQGRWKILYSNVDHQKDDGAQCGMFALWYLAQRSKNHSPWTLAENPMSAQQMVVLRHEWFARPPEFLQLAFDARK